VLSLLAVAVTIAVKDCCHRCHHWHPTHSCYWRCCFSCRQFVISAAVTGFLSSFFPTSVTTAIVKRPSVSLLILVLVMVIVVVFVIVIVDLLLLRL